MKSRQYANVRFAGFRGGRKTWNAIIRAADANIPFSSLSNAAVLAIGRFTRLQLGLKPLASWEEDAILGFFHTKKPKSSSPCGPSPSNIPFRY